jgi:hypothetical protein
MRAGVLLLLLGAQGSSAGSFPSLSAEDLEGRAQLLAPSPDGRAIVFVFLGTECPIANRCLPELKALQAEFVKHGIAFAHVYPNADETPEAIRRHRAEYQLPAQAYRDPEHILAAKLKAHRTPEVVALAADGRLIYQGRVNDLYGALGVSRPQPTRHDLAEHLRAFLQGAPPAGVVQPAVGCSFRSPP